MNSIPVILVCYNRPRHTSAVLKALEEHNVRKLLIFSDAPKTDAETEGVLQTRELISTIKWTRPEIVFQKENQGLAKSIVTAVNYAFEKSDRVILLEDDCVPQKYFFDFMSECLERFEDNEKIFGITGYSITLPASLLTSYPFDHYFCQRIGSWGWGTWKSAWARHEYDLAALASKVSENKIDINQCGNDISLMVQRLLQGQLKDVWTLTWVLTVYLNGGCYIYPTRSHIQNIGFDGSGVHCGGTDKFDSNIAREKPRSFSNDIIFDSNIIRYFKQYYDAYQEASVTTEDCREEASDVKLKGDIPEEKGAVPLSFFRKLLLKIAGNSGGRKYFES